MQHTAQGTVETLESSQMVMLEHRSGVLLRTMVIGLTAFLTVVATVWNNPVNSLIGYAILAAGVPAFLYWRKANAA